MGLFGRDTKLDREAVFEQLKIDEGVVNEITLIGKPNICASCT